MGSLNLNSGDEAELHAAILQSWERLDDLHQGDRHDTYRIFHGHFWGFPYLNIEKFADIAVVLCEEHHRSFRKTVVHALLKCFSFRGVLAKHDRRFDRRGDEPFMEVWSGELPEDGWIVRECGLRFRVHPQRLKNLGLFLDARPAREWLLRNSKGRKILNLFAYTGSLGVAAMAGAAASVLHIDTQRSYLDFANQNHALNQLRMDERGFVRGDIYQLLPKAARRSHLFSGIILDAPPRVPPRSNRRPIGQDLKRLTKLCIPMLAPEGWLLCFIHRQQPRLRSTEQDVYSASPAPLRVLWRGESGLDFPEYEVIDKLKFVAFCLDRTAS